MIESHRHGAQVRLRCDCSAAWHDVAQRRGHWQVLSIRRMIRSTMMMMVMMMMVRLELWSGLLVMIVDFVILIV